MASKETETPKAAEAPATKKVTCIAPGGVNVRKEPKIGAGIRGEVAHGQRVEVLRSVNGWYETAAGFVMAKFFE